MLMARFKRQLMVGEIWTSSHDTKPGDGAVAMKAWIHIARYEDPAVSLDAPQESR